MAKQTEFLPLPWEQAKGAGFKEVTGPLFAPWHGECSICGEQQGPIGEGLTRAPCRCVPHCQRCGCRHAIGGVCQ